MKRLKLIILLTNVLICCLSAQSDKIVQTIDSTKLVFSLTPYSITSQEITQLSDTTTAKMSWLYGHWFKQENLFAPSTQLFRIYLPSSDSVILSVKDVKGNAVGNPFKHFINKGYHTVKIYILKESGIFRLTAKFCDSTFARNIMFVQ